MNKTWYTYRDIDLFGSYISQKKILSRYKEYFCGSYFNILYRDNMWLPIPLENAPEDASASFDDVIKVIKEKGQVDVISTWYRRPGRSIRYDGASFSYDGQTYNDVHYDSYDKTMAVGKNISVYVNPANPGQIESGTYTGVLLVAAVGFVFIELTGCAV